MSPPRYVSAAEAAAALGVTRATLYAYVSRGLVRSEPAPGRRRRRRYRWEDVAALLARRSWRRHPRQAAADALHFGVPVLPSALTLIADGRLYYRGHDALMLAQQATLEQVAALLWTGEPDATRLFPSPPSPGLEPAGLSTIERFQVALPQAAAADVAAFDLSAAGVAQTGARILTLLGRLAATSPAGAAAGQEADLAGQLQQAWSPQCDQARSLLSAALVLCADHELNVSTFTARCVASAGSTPYGVVLAGLAALQGALHGGHTARVAGLFQEVAAAGEAQSVVVARLRRGDGLPGFGHPLYPDGDPRARLLLELTAAAAPRAPALARAEALMAAARRSLQAAPALDFALVVAARVLAWPSDAPLTLFALGRTAGWIGHAIEQYGSGQLIRPRAHYAGPTPDNI